MLTCRSCALVVLVGLIITPIAWGQGRPEVQAANPLNVQRVRRDSRIFVRFMLVNSSDHSWVIPTCGDLNGERYVCDLATHLEVRTPSGWHRAAVKCRCALPGGILPKTTVTVQQGERQEFTYQFAADFFAVRRGQRLRLVLDAWLGDSDVQSTPTLQLASAQFRMP